MGNGIQLDPDSNNPMGCYFAFCPRCHGKTNELVMVGKRKFKVKCSECGCVNYAATNGEKCGKCGIKMHGCERIPLEENEALPGGLCESCQAEMKEHEEIVKKGGVYFRCEECGISGVIKKSEYSMAVRRAHNNPDDPPFDKSRDPAGNDYAPCGVSFNSCKDHEGAKQDG